MFLSLFCPTCPGTTRTLWTAVASSPDISRRWRKDNASCHGARHKQAHNQENSVRTLRGGGGGNGVWGVGSGWNLEHTKHTKEAPAWNNAGGAFDIGTWRAPAKQQRDVTPSVPPHSTNLGTTCSLGARDSRTHERGCPQWLPCALGHVSTIPCLKARVAGRKRKKTLKFSPGCTCACRLGV